MNSLSDKILNYLKKRSEKCTVSEINSSDELKGTERSMIIQELTKLTEQGAVTRCLEKGKAYYSFKMDFNSFGNPYRKSTSHENNASSALNSLEAFYKNKHSTNDDVKSQTAKKTLSESTKELYELAAAVENGSRIAPRYAENTEKGANIYDPIPSARYGNFTFSKHLKYENDEYTFYVPDNFVLWTREKNKYAMRSNGEEERDFIAWLPDPVDPNEYQYANIKIYSGKWNIPIMENIRPALNNAKSYQELDKIIKVILSTVFSPEPSEFNTMALLFGFEPELLSIPYTSSGAYAGIYNSDVSDGWFYFQIFFITPSFIQQIRIDVDAEYGKDTDKLYDMICGLAHKFISKFRLSGESHTTHLQPSKNTYNVSNSNKLHENDMRAITKELYSQLFSASNEFVNEIGKFHKKWGSENYYTGVTSESRMKYETEKLIKKEVKSYEKTFEQAADYMINHSPSNKGNSVLLILYESLCKLIENNKVISYEDTFNGLSYKFTVENANAILRRMKTKEVKELLAPKELESVNKELSELSTNIADIDAQISKCSQESIELEKEAESKRLCKNDEITLINEKYRIEIDRKKEIMTDAKEQVDSERNKLQNLTDELSELSFVNVLQKNKLKSMIEQEKIVLDELNVNYKKWSDEYDAVMNKRRNELNIIENETASYIKKAYLKVEQVTKLTEQKEGLQKRIDELTNKQEELKKYINNEV